MPLESDTLVRMILQDRAKLHAYIWAIVRDEDLAEDVFQDVVLQAIAKQQEIESEPHLMGWLRKAARFESLKALRRRRTRPTVVMDEDLLELLEDRWQSYDRVSNAELVDSLRKCLATLSPAAVSLVRMRYVEGLSGEQAAKKLRQKTHSIYVAIGRIHRRLARCMEQKLAEGRDG